MRRIISGTAIAVLASATLLAGCGDDTATTDTGVDTTNTMDDMSTMDPMATMDDMATMDS